MNGLFRSLIIHARVRPLGVAMPGPRLPQRIRQIIDAAPTSRISRARVAFLIAACAAICAAFLTVTLTRAQSSAMLDWEKAAGGKMSFDVASVKQNQSGESPANNVPRSNFPLNNQDSYYATGGLLSATNYRLDNFIGFAYKLTPTQIESVRSQLPKWATTGLYDVQARAPGNPTKDQMRLMTRSLLADRFKLAAHREIRQGPVLAFALVKAGETGPQLKSHSNDAPCADISPPVAPGTPPSPPPALANGMPAACGALRTLLGPRGYRVSARNVTLAQFAGYLPGAPMNSLDRPLLDRTGLQGTFDLTLEWKPDMPINLNGANYAFAESAETFLEALKDQLGLKLVSTTGPIDTLIIDHIEMPSPN